MTYNFFIFLPVVFAVFVLCINTKEEHRIYFYFKALSLSWPFNFLSNFLSNFLCILLCNFLSIFLCNFLCIELIFSKIWLIIYLSSVS